MDCILAIDVGTQSLRACIMDSELSVLERQQVHYTPRVLSRDKVEIEAEILWDALVEACRKLVHRNRVQVITFSTLCPSLLPMDAAGTPLRPIILHLDRRSYQQAQWALQRVGEEQFLNIAGNLPVPGGISATSLLWIRDREPEIYAKRGVCFGHAVTFYMKRLTDRFVIDPSNASFTGLYDTVGYGDWDERLCGPLEIDRRKLPDVLMSVNIGANDTTCATVGAGVTETGKIMNTSGTVEILVLCVDKPILSRNHLLRTHAYPGRWLAMRTVGAGGASMEWFRLNFCKEMTKETFYEDYLQKVLAPDKVPEARFYPYLTGDRHRIKRKSAAFTRLTLNTNRDDLLLALAYGIISFQIESIAEWKKSVSLSKEIYHVGGGASNAYTGYKQSLLKDFRFVRLGETTLAGAARLALEANAAR
ncbi:MAG: FGGY family carbohydrate kinase [Desulfobacterales bacterium]